MVFSLSNSFKFDRKISKNWFAKSMAVEFARLGSDVVSANPVDTFKEWSDKFLYRKSSCVRAAGVATLSRISSCRL